MDDNAWRAQMAYDAHKKSAGVAYLLWFFVGVFGAHRFYLGATGSGVAQLLLLLLGWIPIGIGWIVLGVWLFVDLFLIPGITRDNNLRLASHFGGFPSYR